MQVYLHRIQNTDRNILYDMRFQKKLDLYKKEMQKSEPKCPES